MGLSAVTSSELPTTYAALVDRLVENGYPAIPARPGSKQPAVRDWQHYSVTILTPAHRAELAGKFPNHGVFCHCDGFVAIDIDLEDAALVALLTAACNSTIGPPVIVRVGKAPRCVILYRTEDTVRTQRLPGLEIRGQGSGVMLFGIHPSTGQPYSYSSLTPLEVPVADLPLATPVAIDLFLQAAATILGHRTNPLLSPSAVPPVALAQITDGRERFVRDQVWQRYLQGWTSASAISEQVFAQLSRHADLTRPHASGAKYDLAFVHSRVLSTLRSAKPIFTKGPRPSVERVVLTAADKKAFRNSINEAGALGQLRPASVLVSHAMLGSIGIANSAYVSTATLAHRIGLAVDTVKRARRELREKGYWVAVDDAGGRAKIAHYLPVLEGEI